MFGMDFDNIEGAMGGIGFGENRWFGDFESNNGV